MNKLNISSMRNYAVAGLAVAFSCYQLYTAIFGALEPLVHRPIHLAFVLGMVFLVAPALKNGKFYFFDGLFSLLGMGLCLYLVFNYERLIWSVGRYSNLDYFVGGLGLLLILEACRRVIGWPLLIVVLVFITYALFGNYFPGFLVHRGFSLSRVVARLYFTTEGVLGIPLGASATYIFLFLLFGTLLSYTGVSAYFLELAMCLAGSKPGGPAKVAVIGSALFGSVSGSSIANVMGTGSFTIPMMKKLGYKPEFAAAVEAVASTGGQLMPPVMGTAAFLMAEFLGVSYWSVVKAAIIPGLLYFVCAYCAVHFEAKRTGLKGLTKAELPKGRKVFKKLYLVSPLALIIIFLAVGYTPIRSALYGMVACIVVGIINPDVKITIRGLIGALQDSANSVLSVAIATANAGIIVGVVTLTGIGMKMGDGLVTLAHGYMFPTLLLVALASLVLGMGVPTAPNYVITSMVAAPALIKLGIDPLVANMFVLYFGIISDITPPVCLSAFAASAIAGSNAIKTGIQASLNGIGGFLAPFIFVASPVLMFVDFTLLDFVISLVSSLLGIVLISGVVAGFLGKKLSIPEQLLLVVAGIFLILHIGILKIIGLLLAGLFFGLVRTKRSNRTASVV